MRQVGSYVIVRELGAGGMGVVYEARHAVLGRRVALKVLHARYAATPEFARRFVDEARAPEIVGHPGVVRVHELGQLPDGAPFLVMELLHGESLRARLARLGRIDARAVIEIGRQVAEVLVAAHAKGVIHRDLKPENVLLVADHGAPGGERVRLLDFGVARLTRELALDHGDGPLTHTGQVLGTPRYMAPEQCAGAREVDGRADVYALGVVLYELLAGRPPFEASSPAALSVMHALAAPHPLRELDPPPPASLAVLVHLMLDKSAGARPDARQVAGALATLPGLGAPGPASAAAADAEPDEEPRQENARARLLLWAMVILLILFCSPLAWLAWR